MLATVGLVVPEFVRVPGAQFSFDAVPNVLDAHDALLDTSMKQILLWVSFAEVCTLAALSNMNEFDRVPGDYGFDPLGVYPTDPAKQEEMKLKELKNGRLVSVFLLLPAGFFDILVRCISRNRGLHLTDAMNPSKLERKQAMVAIGGMVVGSSITGHGFPYL